MRKFFGRLALNLARLLSVLILLAASTFAIVASYVMAGGLGVAGSALMVFGLVILPAYRYIPTLKHGAVMFCGIRTFRVLSEGPSFVIPWLEKVVYFDHRAQNLEVEETFLCADGLFVTMSGEVQHQIDPGFISGTYMENSKEATEQGIRSSIIHAMGVVASVTNAADLSKNWEAVSLLINCSLRMAKPPHAEELVAAENRVWFYRENAALLGNRLQSEKRLAEERSEVEARYGIVVRRFTLKPLRYSPATSQALELPGQARLQVEAAHIKADGKKAIAEKLRGIGVEAKEALNSTEVTLGEAQRRIVDVEGLKKFRPLAPESFDRGRIQCFAN